MVTTDDPELWSAMWSYKDHGKSWEAIHHRAHPPGPRLVHDSFGTNWRMIEMQAAIGLVQLERMPAWTARRAEIARRLTDACLGSACLRVPTVPSDVEHAWYRVYAFVRPERLAPGWSRDRIVDAINAAGGLCMHGSASEVYLEKAFDGTGWRPPERLPVARRLGETSLAFFCHPTLTDAEVTTMCEAMQAVFSEALAG